MGPSELLSVRLFKQHITKYLPQYSSVDEDKVLNTLQRSLSINLYDSAQFLKQELQAKQVNFENLLEEYVSDLADHYVQDPASTDLIIEQLLKNNYFSFTSRVDEAKELQLAIQRNERKRLKELLRLNDEQQEEEELRIVFERIERKELKKQLQAEEGVSQFVASQRQPFSGGMWLRIAAILLVVLIPAGIIIYRNISEPTGTGLAKKGSQNGAEQPQYMAVEDISGFLEINLPAEDIKNFISEIDSDIQRGQGYGSDEDYKIEIRVKSKSNQITYLKNKIDTIESKIQLINNQLNQSKVHSKTIKELQDQIIKLQLAEAKCRKLLEQINKTELIYEFNLSRLTIYSNKEVDPKRFTVREERNVDTYEKEYFLLKDDKLYQRLVLKKE